MARASLVLNMGTSPCERTPTELADNLRWFGGKVVGHGADDSIHGAGGPKAAASKDAVVAPKVATPESRQQPQSSSDAKPQVAAQSSADAKPPVAASSHPASQSGGGCCCCKRRMPAEKAPDNTRAATQPAPAPAARAAI
eukprot:gnl/TRDRNA2_/TRDRNA2_166008_c0_seq1.p2 gnl/TRDRNA2_/TRDRNA2_166008_c0~~gnl/TRDRNA2_/TRDRNA2_166008_c0_seq1.p2  ORF type:complete len:140 (-),score=31.58 gnl/TRDRNA2_/TRDRNA2_166008_c0_seq1:44-463(-)